MSYIEDNGYLIFNGEKSSDYGVWVNGGGTFNAPVRRVKEYVVPGRNGSLTIDEGVFEDIDHVYPAFIPKDFSTNIEAFRNVLMANGGYVELEDSFHPNEFYRAKYVSGLDVDVAPGGVGGAFNLIFRRDPRRFLKSGRKIITYPYGEKDSPNLLPYPYYSTTKTSGNIKWTDNGDGTITTTGYQTSAATVTFVLRNAAEAFTLPVGTYVLSGCPKGGSTTTYRIGVEKHTGTTSNYFDYGDGVEFTVTSDTDVYTAAIEIRSNAHDVTGLTFKPMIRNKYGENLITWPYKNGTSKTAYGVTFTATDGSISTSGTNTGTYYSRYMIRESSTEIDRVYLEKGKEYKLTGCPANGGDSKYYICLLPKYGGSVYDMGNGVTFTASTQESNFISSLYTQVERNIDSSGLVFTPALRQTAPAEDIGYVPYWVRGSALYNPTQFEAKPFIKVGNNSTVIHNGTLTINGKTITITNPGCEYLYIDSEMQECYTDQTIPPMSLNDKVVFEGNKFPVLNPGVNSIAFSGDVTYVEITPRWWIV